MTTTERIVCISGANRGLGHGLALAMAERACQVVATYRDESRSRALIAAAEGTGRIHPVRADVTDEKDLERLHDFIAEGFGHLDILVNSAGVNPDKTLPLNELEWGTFARTLHVNVGGPHLTTRMLHPLLKRGNHPKVVNISSQMGSIQLSSGDMPAYRVSKAALNMLTRNQAMAYREDGITVVSLHPGWVRTDMGGPAAPLSIAQAVEKLLDNVERVTLDHSGQFISHDGESIPY
jgi:NAD(P)-dependent dehydrogenase (short-subunit alcohol dehydrogenase family)